MAVAVQVVCALAALVCLAFVSPWLLGAVVAAGIVGVVEVVAGDS